MNIRLIQSIGQQAIRCVRLSTLTTRNFGAIAGNQLSQLSPRYCVVLLPFVGVASSVNCSAAETATKKQQYSTAAALDMSNGDYKNAASIYEFNVKDTHGNDVSLEKYKGQVVLVVNIASKCGLTKNNYQKLTDLKEKYGERGLTILNFPCNQFGSQMPEADGEAMVCHLRDSKADIGEVFAKVDVNGDNAAPIYKYLKAKQTGTLGSGIKWNFTKFLVNKEGIPINRYAPTTDPMDIAKDIEKLL
ncbi:probable phospholipid hydroperoxide glutathione peroxidase isoform X1 [Drosophila grimshawi]|uniref:Glutathione peroxidase n=2 Tax=Drosophila grimshawi TaxID=7222 RepID=B4J1W6_DROGR|nr:probable phospholipid hydroperoxide glutathione peroxidase isoform X1 [Drosophila grimshawi]EDV95891.1 GH15953 [Drosophila grimshawi]